MKPLKRKPILLQVLVIGAEASKKKEGLRFQLFIMDNFKHLVNCVFSTCLCGGDPDSKIM